MSHENDEKNNYLAAHHELKFSKINQNPQKIIDTERRTLIFEYLAAKQL